MQWLFSRLTAAKWNLRNLNYVKVKAFNQSQNQTKTPLANAHAKIKLRKSNKRIINTWFYCAKHLKVLVQILNSISQEFNHSKHALPLLNIIFLNFIRKRKWNLWTGSIRSHNINSASFPEQKWQPGHHQRVDAWERWHPGWTFSKVLHGQKSHVARNFKGRHQKLNT